MLLKIEAGDKNMEVNLAGTPYVLIGGGSKYQ